MIIWMVRPQIIISSSDIIIKTMSIILEVRPPAPQYAIFFGRANESATLRSRIEGIRENLLTLHCILCIIRIGDDQIKYYFVELGGSRPP